MPMRDGSHRYLFDSGVISMVLGRSPKFGALVMTAPTPVIDDRSVVVIALIAPTAGRIPPSISHSLTTSLPPR